MAGNEVNLLGEFHQTWDEMLTAYSDAFSFMSHFLDDQVWALVTVICCTTSHRLGSSCCVWERRRIFILMTQSLAYRMPQKKSWMTSYKVHFCVCVCAPALFLCVPIVLHGVCVKCIFLKDLKRKSQCVLKSQIKCIEDDTHSDSPLLYRVSTAWFMFERELLSHCAYVMRYLVYYIHTQVDTNTIDR